MKTAITSLSPRSMLRTVLLIAPLLIGSGYLEAKCVHTEPIVLPESGEMPESDMAKIQVDVQAYMSDAKVYLSCVRGKKRRDRAVDEMREVAANFNVLIHLYREYLDEKQAYASTGN